MTTATLTLTDFLLARIAEDEECAMEALDEAWIMSDGERTVRFLEHFDPTYVLLDTKAKRAIMAMQPPSSATLHNGPPILRILASVYSDHPDYREQWRG